MRKWRNRGLENVIMEFVFVFQMSEQFNKVLSLSGKIPSGVFNAVFGFRGCWQKDAAPTKRLAFDGWFITLYNVELERSNITLSNHVKQEVPTAWDPAALAEYVFFNRDMEFIPLRFSYALTIMYSQEGELPSLRIVCFFFGVIFVL